MDIINPCIYEDSNNGLTYVYCIMIKMNKRLKKLESESQIVVFEDILLANGLSG